MTTYYLDTSALSKRYVEEIGSGWIRMLTAPTSGHVLLTARITMVEVYSALARRKREGSVSPSDCAIAVQAFTAHSATEYDFVELDLKIVTLARRLLEQHPLRAYDAIQLASALQAHRALKSVQLADIVFLSADNRLNSTAEAEGLTVDNPNLHP